MADNNENKVLNVPHLRFPEFSGEWKKHSLGEIGETIIGLTYKPSDVVDNNGIIVFRSSNIKNGMIDYSDLVRVNKHIKDKIITKENDILVCARNGSQRLIGKNAIIKQEDANNTFGAFMMVYRANDNPFILPLLSTKKYFSQVGENLGARINQITTSDFNGFEFYFPENHAERTKIAELFRLLDERIATQNKIIEDLKKLKSAIIHRCYSSQTNMIPLSELLKQCSDRNRSGSDLQVLSVSNKYGFIAQSDQFEDREVASDDTSNYKVVKKGMFAYNPARINVGSIALYEMDSNGIVSPMYVCFTTKSELLPSYLKYYFASQTFKHEMYKRLEGSVRLCLTFEELCNIEIHLPSIEQQKNISKYISKIENNLSLVDSIFSKYQQQRRYLLSQMFI
ncbi:restriction endonuclease subunit S [Bacteroides fragilis]|uniref:restriction endonuclease subunit S n=2 Tax=Bacteroides fragilis TaxID=817 RepID=UPI0035653F4F